ncbi:hypothetical protein [Cryobacterium sp. BB307]|uniref:hypothetical protein n=1 Tax=Cryobacterium sp. BB307 TaxID=2716317 RepID=UPI0014462B13|nr:hypothetical protein [Cryobacterium sp. BB307]
MEIESPPALDILTPFFAERLEGESDAVRKRMLAVHERFGFCLLKDIYEHGTEELHAVLTLERILEPRYSVLHIVGAASVLWGLVAFLLDDWKQIDTLTRIEQLRFAGQLRDRIVYGGMVCVECEGHQLGHIQELLVAGRRELKEQERERRERRRAARGGAGGRRDQRGRG